VTLHTSVGDLKVEVYCEEVPRTAENFLALCASGYYDGTKFHRRARVAACGSTGVAAHRVWRMRTETSRVSWCRAATRRVRSALLRGVAAADVGCAGSGRGGASIWGGKFPDEIRDTLKVR